MKATSLAVSNNILYRAKKENIHVTPMKLQKLLYYFCVKYMRETKMYPLSEYFQVWKYGPVLQSVYAEFKPYGSSNITDFARNSAGRAKMVDEEANPCLRSSLDSVWSILKNYSGVYLSEKTHQKGSGWYTAYQRGEEVISEEDIMNDTTF